MSSVEGSPKFTSATSLLAPCAPHFLGPVDALEDRMIRAIHECTEKEREEFCSDKLNEVWNLPAPLLGFAPLLKRADKPYQQKTYACHITWSALLLRGDCIEQAARTARCTKEDLIKFAINICPYSERYYFINGLATKELLTSEMTAALKPAISTIAKIISSKIHEERAPKLRIQKGARIGGQKSAITRRAKAKTPSLEFLDGALKKLEQEGKDRRQYASILAQRLDIFPVTVRKKIQQLIAMRSGTSNAEGENHS